MKLDPTGITEFVGEMSNAKSFLELETQAILKKMESLYVTFRFNIKNTSKKTNIAEIFRAFMSAHPGSSLCNLIALRSGRIKRNISLNVDTPVNLEDSESKFALIYNYFLGIFVNAMNKRKDVKNEYFSSGCVKESLLELKSLDFIKHKDKSPRVSPTAYAITAHLTLIYKTSREESLIVGLREELKRNDYFTILKIFGGSKYA